MSWNKERTNRVYQQVETFLKDLFEKEAKSLEDVNNVVMVVTSILQVYSIVFSYGCGIGRERQNEERRKWLRRLRKPPPGVV